MCSVASCMPFNCQDDDTSIKADVLYEHVTLKTVKSDALYGHVKLESVKGQESNSNPKQKHQTKVRHKSSNLDHKMITKNNEDNQASGYSYQDRQEGAFRCNKWACPDTEEACLCTAATTTGDIRATMSAMTAMEVQRTRTARHSSAHYDSQCQKSNAKADDYPKQRICKEDSNTILLSTIRRSTSDSRQREPKYRDRRRSFHFMPKHLDGMSECDRKTSQNDSKAQAERNYANCDYTLNVQSPKHKTLKKPRCEHPFCKIERLKNQYKAKAYRDDLSINRDAHIVDTDDFTINSMYPNITASEGPDEYQLCYQTKMEPTAVEYQQHQKFRKEQLHRKKKQVQYNQLMVEKYLNSLSVENAAKLQIDDDPEDYVAANVIRDYPGTTTIPRRSCESCHYGPGRNSKVKQRSFLV